MLNNPTDGPVTETIDVGGWSSVEDLLGNPLDREGDSLTLTVDSLDVRVLILEK